MSSGSITSLIHQLRQITGRRGGTELADAELLERFVTRREEAAFEVLVQRHGPMVLGVCRHFLHDAHEAEVAFQATFVVLVRKAPSLQRRALLSNWLYGVAYRIATRARRDAARQHYREKQGVEVAVAAPACVETCPELLPVVHEELSRLPDKYRVPVVLCYFQGKSNEEAARQLAWPVGTVKGRLARARELLRRRLTRRGVTLSAAALATALSNATASATMPALLVNSTVKAAILVAAGRAIAVGVVSAPVAALTKGALRAMLLPRFTITCTVLLGIGVLGAMAGWLAQTTVPAQPGEAEGRSEPTAKGRNEPKKETEKSSEAKDRR